MTRMVITISFMFLIWILNKWIQEKEYEDAYNDYSSPKPPLYVYYNTSGISLPLPIYFISAAVVSILIGAIFYKMLNNIMASVLLVAILIYLAKQQIIIRSINNSQKIDQNAPTFLTTFSSYYKTVSNPIFALENSYQYAHKSYRHTLEVLFIRISNGAEPYQEVEKAKKFFRNRIIRNFLDDLEEELEKGGTFNITLDRLIDRAMDRKRYASQRKIETYATVLVIYMGLLFELFILMYLYLFKTEWFVFFQNSVLGQMGILLIVLVSGFMVILAQRLVLLGEG